MIEIGKVENELFNGKNSCFVNFTDVKTLLVTEWTYLISNPQKN